MDLKGLGKFPGFKIVWDTVSKKCIESKMHIKSGEQTFSTEDIFLFIICINFVCADFFLND